MKINIILVILAFISITLSGCVEENGTPTHELKTFSAEEFLPLIINYNKTILDETKYVFYNFTSLEDGDEVLIKDTIHNLTFHSSNNYTTIYFITELNSSLPFSGNLTKKFFMGDKVEIDLHIIRDEFMHPYNSAWTISIQTIEEGWDRTNHAFIPFSSNTIKKV